MLSAPGLTLSNHMRVVLCFAVCCIFVMFIKTLARFFPSHARSRRCLCAFKKQRKKKTSISKSHVDVEGITTVKHAPTLENNNHFIVLRMCVMHNFRHPSHGYLHS